ncbi:acyl-CoA reductase [Paeniglutamicibacter sulfureus]|uniref:acyl-CoA reductase n=1 Tax=Paeniglutamicibacter sulfureus TaxID=43666 RepID=UPI0035F08FD1
MPWWWSATTDSSPRRSPTAISCSERSTRSRAKSRCAAPERSLALVRGCVKSRTSQRTATRSQLRVVVRRSWLGRWTSPLQWATRNPWSFTLGRILRNHSFDAINEVLRLVEPLRRELQTVGVACWPQSLEAWPPGHGACGLYRASVVGRMPEPAAGWHHDGVANPPA